MDESATIKTSVENHDREDCWKEHCQGTLLFVVYDTPGVEEAGRKAIEQEIRELRALIFDAVSRHTSGMLSLDAFRSVLSPTERSKIGGKSLLEFGLQLPTLREARVLLIEEAMRRANHNQSAAARLLGITRQGLSKHLKALEAD